LSTVNNSPVLNDGSTIHTRCPRLDGSCASCSGRWVEALQCRQSAMTRRSDLRSIPDSRFRLRGPSAQSAPAFAFDQRIAW